MYFEMMLGEEEGLQIIMLDRVIWFNNAEMQKKI